MRHDAAGGARDAATVRSSHHPVSFPRQSWKDGLGPNLELESCLNSSCAGHRPRGMDPECLIIRGILEAAVLGGEPDEQALTGVIGSGVCC